MEPTMAEIIWGAVIALGGLVFLTIAFCSADEPVEIDAFKRRDWEREAKRWR